MTEELKNELIKIFVDKGLLVLIIAFAGYFFNKQIEKYKGKIIYRQKLSEVRISIYQDMSSQFMLYYLDTIKFIEWYNKFKKINYTSEEKRVVDLEEQINHLEFKYKEVQLVFSRASIFLSADVADKIVDYFDTQKLMQKALKDEKLWSENFGNPTSNIIANKLSSLSYSLAKEINSTPK